MSAAADKGRVVVAHEESTIRNLAAAVLRRAGYEVVAVADGDSARVLLSSAPPPRALVVDVGLTGEPFYALCEHIADRGLPTKVVLIASVYSRTGYKRRPTELYGADDYVEQHHIVDSLVEKVGSVLAGARPALPRHGHGPDRGFEAEDSKVRVAGERRLRFRHDTHGEADDLAERLAHLIVADLALYNAEEIAEWGRRDLSVDAMPERLARGLDEARRMFEERVPPEVAFDRDYVLDALIEFARPPRC